MKVRLGRIKQLIKEELAKNVATRYVGTCGFCGKEQRVQDNQLVLHGYKRPGHGYTEGRCPGVGNPPYELSPLTAKMGLRYFTGLLDEVNDDMSRLESDPLSYTVEVGFRNKELLTIAQAVDRKNPNSSYRQMLIDDMVKSVKSSLRSKMITLKDYVSTFEKRVIDWVEKPLKTFDEDVAQKSSDRQEKKTAADAKRQAKYEEHKSKLIERVKSSFAKLRTQEDKYRVFDGLPLNEKTYKLADDMFDRHRNLVQTINDNVYKMWDMMRMSGKKKDWFYHDLGMDDTLSHLGILVNGDYVETNNKSSWERMPRMGNVWKPGWPGYTS